MNILGGFASGCRHYGPWPTSSFEAENRHILPPLWMMLRGDVLLQESPGCSLALPYDYNSSTRTPQNYSWPVFFVLIFKPNTICIAVYIQLIVSGLSFYGVSCVPTYNSVCILITEILKWIITHELLSTFWKFRFAKVGYNWAKGFRLSLKTKYCFVISNCSQHFSLDSFKVLKTVTIFKGFFWSCV